MPYTAEKPPLRRSIEELRATIPGWGVDLDPADRPGVPNQRFAPEITGAHWDFPERQPELWPRERSPEHKFLPPVFGTSCPPKGLSGVIRKFAYRYSEGRSSHWLLLVAADRVDVLESRIGSALSGRPDNVIAETGVQSEWKHHPVRSRLGHHRADLKHVWIDPLITMAPYLLAGYGAYSLAAPSSAAPVQRRAARAGRATGRRVARVPAASRRRIPAVTRRTCTPRRRPTRSTSAAGRTRTPQARRPAAKRRPPGAVRAIPASDRQSPGAHHAPGLFPFPPYPRSLPGRPACHHSRVSRHVPTPSTRRTGTEQTRPGTAVRPAIAAREVAIVTGCPYFGQSRVLSPRIPALRSRPAGLMIQALRRFIPLPVLREP